MSEEFFEHNPHDHEDPIGGTTWLVGVVSVIILAASFLGLTALFHAEEEEVQDELTQPESIAIKELKEEQNKRLIDVYRVKDQPERFIIPIEDAIDEYVKAPYASAETSN